MNQIWIKTFNQNNKNSSHRWYRRRTDHQNREDINFDQSELESNEEKVFNKLSSIIRYAPNSKDYVYIISKAVRWLTFCK